MTLLTLNRRGPQAAEREMQNEYRDFMNSFERARQRYAYDCLKVPAVNITEEPNRFVLEVAAPGYSKNDFSINIEKDLLTISANIEEENDAGSIVRVCEFSKGSFKRQFNLGKSIDTSKIDAAYKNGILTIELHKKEEAIEKPARTIKID